VDTTNVLPPLALLRSGGGRGRGGRPDQTRPDQTSKPAGHAVTNVIMSDSKITTTKGPGLVVEVYNSVTAAALVACGVPFSNPEKQATLFQYGNGLRRPSWKLKSHSPDGLINTEKLAKEAHDRPAEWIAENPEHPFAYALSAALLASKYLDAEKEARAIVGYRLSGGRAIFVFENSRKHEKLKASNAEQI
jgi:hypothetical protein